MNTVAFSCEYCGTSGTFLSITGKGETPLKGSPHYHVYEDYLLDCPNQCGAMSIVYIKKTSLKISWEAGKKLRVPHN